MKQSCDRIAKVLGLEQRQYFEGSGVIQAPIEQVIVSKPLSRDNSRDRSIGKHMTTTPNGANDYHSIRTKSPYAGRQIDEHVSPVTKYTAVSFPFFYLLTFVV